jgi:hypothetical protein
MNILTSPGNTGIKKAGRIFMEYTCDHCEHPTTSIHPVTLYKTEGEQDELLCDECYAEWLESIKG